MRVGQPYTLQDVPLTRGGCLSSGEARELAPVESPDMIQGALSAATEYLTRGIPMPFIVHLHDPQPAVAVYKQFDISGYEIPPSSTGAVTYTSSDPTVATVDAATGVLTYIKGGITTITASDNGNLISSDI